MQPLVSSLGLSASIPVPGEDPAAADVDVHAAVSGLADRLLERVAAATSLLQQHAGALAPEDALTARLLLSDLSMVATAWQALETAAAARLDDAAERLTQARQTLDRALRATERPTTE